MYFLLRPLLFLLSAEKAHHFSLGMLSLVYRLPLGKQVLQFLFYSEKKNLAQDLWGLHFKNPVGLAAGFDKNAKYIDALACLGFGFIEIGTVTPLPQDGNPLPRLFRLPKDKAIINRMGFNNDGVDAVVARLKKRKSDVIIGGNIGKNKITPNEEATKDYVICFEKLFAYVDYFVVNVSSPNTPNLRELQEKSVLFELLNTLQKINEQKTKPKPILLKIAPDLNETQLDDILEVVHQSKIAGIIASNTTLDRSGLQTDEALVSNMGAGGLSGEPLLNKSNEVLRYLQSKNEHQIPIIAVGGISNAKSAQQKLNLGAQLIQVYSGFIYEGPSMVKNLLKKIQLNK